MESNDSIIHQIINDNEIFRYMSELQNIEDEARKIIVTEILMKLRDGGISKSESAKGQINDIRNKLNQNSLKKKWYRLLKEQQVELVIQYFKAKIENCEEREKETSKILKLIELGTLKNKNITYDEKEGIINEIKN